MKIPWSTIVIYLIASAVVMPLLLTFALTESVLVKATILGGSVGFFGITLLIDRWWKIHAKKKTCKYFVLQLKEEDRETYDAALEQVLLHKDDKRLRGQMFDAAIVYVASQILTEDEFLRRWIAARETWETPGKQNGRTPAGDSTSPE